MTRSIDEAKIESAVKDIIDALHLPQDADFKSLEDTPKRVAKMFEEITRGYGENAKEHLQKTFDCDANDIVLEKDIDFSSTCEHHLMPFFGKVHVAYIPNGKVVGLSKLARTVEVYARRLQLQERMTCEIASAIYAELQPKGVFVVVEAEHTCMTARGVKKVGSKTVTSSAVGEMSEADINRIFSMLAVK